MKGSIVVVGASLGGLAALQTLLPALPEDFPWPLAIVQHRLRDGHGKDSLAHTLQSYCALPVRDAEDKAPVEPGCIVLAPADYHLMLEAHHYALSTESAVSFARPSVDVLFESAAEAYGAGVVAVILTGTGQDGAHGVRAVKEARGRVIVQDPLMSEAPAMPRAALSALGLAKGLSLDEIADELAHLKITGKGAMMHGRTRSREDLTRRR